MRKSSEGLATGPSSEGRRAMAPRASQGVTVSCGVALLVSVVLAWSARGANSDFFMCLAGGEDVAAGRLATPDTWSYITDGRIWVNQSWLTHWALYCLWEAGGPACAVVVRAALIGVLVIGSVMWLRVRRMSWPAIFVATAIFLLVCRYYFYFALRGNLVTIAIIPWFLWMLERQRAHSVFWAAPAGIVLAVWTQCHGGNIYGWMVVGLWLAVHLPLAVCEAAPWNLRRWMALAGAATSGLLVTLIAGPFGAGIFAPTVTMLPQSIVALVCRVPILGARLQPLIVPGASEWRTIHDWWPLVRHWNSPLAELRTTFEEIGPYLLYLAGLCVLGVVAAGAAWDRRRRSKKGALLAQRAGRRGAGSQSASAPDSAAGHQTVERPTSLALFYALLIAGTLAMAFSGRRFIPISALTLMLPLGLALDLLWSRPGAAPGRSAGVVGGILAICTLALVYPMVVLGFSQENPFLPPQSVFERQFVADGFPVGAARFMRRHGVGGNVFHSYNIEDYLRWAVPHIKVNCGGRAQQIYTGDDLRQTRLIEGQVPDPNYLQPAAMAVRREYFLRHQVTAIVLAVGADWDMILALMGVSPPGAAEWTPAYFDGDWCLLIRASAYPKLAEALEDQKRAAVEQPDAHSRDTGAAEPTETERLAYPSDISRSRTRALYLAWKASASGGGSDVAHREVALATIKTAQRLRPSPALYDLAMRLARGAAGEDVDAWMQGEYDRIQDMHVAGAQSIEILQSRIVLAGVLMQRVRGAGDRTQAGRMQSARQAAIDEWNSLRRWWQL